MAGSELKSGFGKMLAGKGINIGASPELGGGLSADAKAFHESMGPSSALDTLSKSISPDSSGTNIGAGFGLPQASQFGLGSDLDLTSNLTSDASYTGDIYRGIGPFRSQQGGYMQGYQEGGEANNGILSKLNQLSDIYFSISVGDEKYVLGPNDEYGGYPDNWILQAQYRGPYRELNGQHVVWVELRSISNEFDLNELDSLELSKNISTTINHELVHFYQLKKQAKSKGLTDFEAYREMVCDTKQVPAGNPERYYEICGEYPPEELGDERELYLTRHGEIDAYAHEAAEQLLDKYSPKEAHNA